MGVKTREPLFLAPRMPAMSTSDLAQPGLHPELESLLAYWFVRRGEGKFPSRTGVGDRERWARHLALFDVLQYGALRIYECRSSAGGLAERLGKSPIGLSTDELAPEIRAGLRGGFEQAWARKAPHIGQAVAYNVRYSDLVLPLSENGLHIDGMLLASYPL
jgi:hypothetical protein